MEFEIFFRVKDQLREAKPETAGERRQKARSTLALLRSDAPADIAELQWRLAMPVSALLLVLIALPLSRVDPYRGKYAKLFAAILLYMAYRHLLGAAKDWVAHGTLPPFPGIWGVHALCLAGILAGFAAVPAARWWRRTPGRLRHRVARWQADRAAARDR